MIRSEHMATITMTFNLRTRRYITSSDLYLCHPTFYFSIISTLLFNQGTALHSHSLIRFSNFSWYCLVSM